jgi:glutamate-1-semialdehyde aminotransferase
MIPSPKITNFSNSENYRNKIHNLIPGGAHTYSKGDDQFPFLSPAAISHGKGAYIWDIDGNKFLDCSMGLTSVSLGHAYEPVIEAVKKELYKGVNFQRPSYLELEMAEKFLALVPQHDMIKFAKNGSTVTTAAVKLARAYTGRKLVAFPGDHPFYSYDDLFIGTTQCNKGVPEEFSNLSVTFKSCDIDSLKQLFEKHPKQIACVITEPEKNTCSACNCSKSPENFLKEAIELAHQHGAVFIIDEMVSGFKSGFPGSISSYDLKPDMATWGKGIANGFSFCALTGTKEVMELAGIQKKGEEKTFLISTTHGGETHSIAAAIATIDIFTQQQVVYHNQTLGNLLISKINHIVDQLDMQKYVDVISCSWLPTFNFRDQTRAPSSSFRTLVMQEMFARGVFFQGYVCPSFSHTSSDIDFITEALVDTFTVYKKALHFGIEHFLIGEEAKPVFRKFL